MRATAQLRILSWLLQLTLLTFARTVIDDPGTCFTQGCLEAKDVLVQSIDTNIDPCTDFYQFSCGGFRNKTPIADDESHVDNFSFQRKNLEKKLTKIVTSKAGPNEPEIFESVRNLYHSCMDKEDGERSVKQMKYMLKHIGGWPVVEGTNWNNTNFSWYKLVEDLNGHGLDSGAYIMLYISSDENDTNRTHLEVGANSLSNNPKGYLNKGENDPIVQSYYQFMVDTAVFFGAEEDTAKTDMKEVLKFEIELEKLMSDTEVNRTMMTMAELKTIYDIPWEQYVGNFLNNDHISKNQEISVESPEYIKQFKELIEKVPARVQANCLFWNAIPIKYLIPLRDIHHKYSKIQTGQKKLSPLSHLCITSFPDSLNIAVGAMFIRAEDYRTTKDEVTAMVENFRKVFVKMLNDLDWMDAKTKKEAINKANLLFLRIGYPDEMLDNNQINEYYRDVKLPVNQTYLQNQLTLTNFWRKKDLEKLENFNKLDWIHESKVTVVNGYYNLVENSIIFPIGFLMNGPFFNAKFPKSMNYGATGFAIGHELTHGFDNRGSLRDGNGNVENWWQPETGKKYLRRSNCIEEQYGNMTMMVDGKPYHDKGEKTLGENIADNGGIKIVYKSYQRFLKENGPEPKLPNLPYTNSQMFWLGTAHMWCSVERPDYLKSVEFVKWTHSPHRLRVNGMLGNMKEFGDDWGCPIGSKMNPVHKCLVW